MRRDFILITLLWMGLCLACPVVADEVEFDVMRASESRIQRSSGVWEGDGEVLVIQGSTVLTADHARVERATGVVEAEGNVRIQHEGQVWVGDQIRYNFVTRQMESEAFRTGAPPLFASGTSLEGDISNRVYVGRSAQVTTDDYEDPFWTINAGTIRVHPGERITTKNATVRLGTVPVFYWPYYSRKIGQRQNRVLFVPGYRSSYGAYVNSGYLWYLNDEVETTLHADYRSKRGFGVGPDLSFNDENWGEGLVRYYYTQDEDPGMDVVGDPIGSERQRFELEYQGNPREDFHVKGKLSYESDSEIRHDFFEGDYQDDPQPITFGQVRQHWADTTLELYAQGRINDHYATVERLPVVRLSVLPMQVGALPIVYQGESSVGHLRHLSTNGLAGGTYEGGRIDTYHQVSLPVSLWGWLLVEGRAGGRATYYSETEAGLAGTEDGWRHVFDTGVSLSTKASRVWPGASSRLLDVAALRHIVQPEVNYTYVPSPDRLPSELPLFDTNTPSFFPSPMEFPAYQAVDGIGARNVVRMGLRNRLQTKREGRAEDLLTLDTFIDWHLDPVDSVDSVSRWSHFHSDLRFRPRNWLTLGSELQLDMETGQLQQAFNSVAIQPGTRWSWGLTQWYLYDDFFAGTSADGPGSHTLLSRFYYRFNENYGFRMSQRVDARSGRLEEHYYTVYRDLRSFTLAVTFRHRLPLEGPDDFTVAFLLSLKASPRHALGDDTVNPTSLVGD